MRVRARLVKVYVDADTYARLRELARKSDMSVSTYIYLLLKKHLARLEARTAVEG